MSKQINVNYDAVTNIINRLHGGIYPMSLPEAHIMVGRRDNNGGLTAGVANKINSISSRRNAPHYVMQRLENNTARMLRQMAEEMRTADEAAAVK